MQAIKVLILENEPGWQRSIADRLENDGRYIVIACAESEVEAIDAIRTKKPDIAILDIHLGPDEPEGGFRIAKYIEKHHSSILYIFLTNLDKAEMPKRMNELKYFHPLHKAFPIEALDGILEKTATLLQKADEEVKWVGTRFGYAKGSDRLVADGSVLLVKDIYYLESDGRYTSFYGANQEKLAYVSVNLLEIEKILTNEGLFIRVHKSFIINRTKALKRLGGRKFILKDIDKEFEVTHVYKRNFNMLFS